MRLPQEFYCRDTISVARELLGKRLVRVFDGQRLAGRIVETEAYLGPQDQASHAYHRTPRSNIMYGPPGYAYIYFIYGMYHCLNTVTEADGTPGAVLIRGIRPDEGLDRICYPSNRSSAQRVADGPGKLCRAFRITRDQNGTDLTRSALLYIEDDIEVIEGDILSTVRVGVRGDEDALTRPWRFIWRNPRPPLGMVL